jgi:RNA polymerase sigma-70 factor (ECF subfamily)
MSEGLTTHVSLFNRIRLRADDQEAWAAFVARYGPRLLQWCRGRGLQDTDAEDVVQDVLVKMVGKLKTYEHRGPGSFRRWLRVITEGACADHLAARRRPGAGSGDSEVARRLDTVEARADLLRQLEEEFDCELLELAMARVRLRVQPHTWEVFRLLALEGHPAAEAAARLGMQPGAVYVARSKVQRMIQEEVRLLDQVEALPTEGEP